MNDFKFALRQLLKTPGFTAMAVLSLAVGIGLNSTVFSALDAAFLRPMKFKDPETIVRIETPAFSLPEYRDLTAQCRTLEGVIAVSRHGALFRRGDSSEMFISEVVSANYFSVLRIGAALGNVFSEHDPALRREPLVVLSYGLWQDRLGGDPAIIGKGIFLNTQTYTVLGVAEKGYRGVNRFPKTDAWFAADGMRGDMENREYRDFALLGRRTPTASKEQAQAEIETIVSRLQLKDSRTGQLQRVLVFSEAESMLDHGGKLAVIIMAFVSLVLLVACANVSAMLLARNEERRREIAVRLGLGAGRWRLVQQLLIESLFLAVLGAVFGLVLTIWAKGALLALIPMSFLQYAPDLRVDHRVLALTIVLTFLATLVFGLAPAWRAGRTDLASVLKGDAGPNADRWRSLRGRSLLVVGQLAVSVVFLVSAGLLVKGFLRGLTMDLGFEQRNLLHVMIAPEMSRMGRPQYLSELMQRVRALPGVKQVSYAVRAPLGISGGGATLKVLLPGDETAGDTAGRALGFNIVETNYFQIMGIRLTRGRVFDANDDGSSAPVAIISEAMARRYWPDQDPLGKSVRIGGVNTPLVEIVGIARDVVRNHIGEVPEPFIYLPFAQKLWGEITLLVETSGDPAAALALVRREMRATDDRVAPIQVDTQKQAVRVALFPQWAAAWLVGGLGLLAFALAAAGLYGVVSYSVVRRTHEIGVRVALGARVGDMMRMILKQGLLLAGIGLAVGLPVAFGLGRVLQSMLFGVSAADPAIWFGSSVVVIGVALLASYFPGRRAMRIDPMVALRCE